MIKYTFKQAGFMRMKIPGTYFSGEMPIEINGLPETANVEQVEIDAPEIAKLKLDPPINFAVHLFPHTQVFVDGKEIYAGVRDEMGGNEDSAPYNTVDGLRTRVQRVVEAYL